MALLSDRDEKEVPRTVVDEAVIAAAQSR